MRLRSAILGCGLAVGAMQHAAMADQTLAITPGLWEYRMAGGAMPLPDSLLASLPPEQRAMVAAALGKALSRSYKVCVTAGQISQGARVIPNAGPSCHWSTVSSSPTALLLRNVCTGGVSSRGTLQITVPNPETVMAKIDAMVDPGTGPMPVKETVNGRFLGADCGGIKPGSVSMQ